MPRPRSWTDDDLRAAVAAATSWRQVRRSLGLVGGGTTVSALRARATELGLDLSRLPDIGEHPRRYTDEQLAHAVAEASNLNGVFGVLGLSVGGAAWRRVQDHIVRLELDTSHWRPGCLRPGEPRPPAPARPDIDDERLQAVLEGATTLADAMRALGLDPSNGSACRWFRERIDASGIPRDELLGRAWATGRTSPTKPPRPIDEVLVRDSPFRGGSSTLRDRLVREGLIEESCATCGLTQWRGRPAPLQLDHVNGDPRDNRRENLRLLCANCHAQTPTFAGRNARRR